MKFSIDIPAQDPLNPFKHKYHPDHDNLDAKFEPFDPTQLSPYLWESFAVKRTIALELTNEPAFEGMTAEEAAATGRATGLGRAELGRQLHRDHRRPAPERHHRQGLLRHPPRAGG